MAKIGALQQIGNKIKLKQRTFKIVLTGPESTGKTLLAATLATALNVKWVPEFARYYVGNLGRPYARRDLSRIGKGQQSWNQWFEAQAAGVLVYDTDWTVLQIWEHYRFGATPAGQWEWQKGYLNPETADLYLLCYPDFPWQPDPLREHPDERQTLYEWYEKLLRTIEARYWVLEGNPEHRLNTAISLIAELSRPL